MAHLMRVGHAARGWEAMPEGTIVCPVPSPYAALVRRGFNPAGILATSMSRQFGWPLIVGLKLSGAKGSSRGLNSEARARRLRGLFEGKPAKVRGAAVVLVDDVMTSGATARAASRALLKAGAQSVDLALLARTPLDPE